MAVTKGPKPPKPERKQRAKKEDENGAEEDKRGCGGGEEADFCVDCGKMVQATQQGLKCDGCGFWHHTVCEKVNEEIYSFLCNHNGEQSLLWYCRKCIVTCKGMRVMMMAMQEQQQHMEEKLNNLVATVQGRFDKQDAQNSKLDAGESTANRVEQKVDALMITVKNNKDIGSSVGEAVTAKLTEDKLEADEISKRKTSIIIHGLKESVSESADERKQADADLSSDMFHVIKCDNVTVNSAVRLGKKQDDPVTNPRALKLVMASEEQKVQILKQAKNLKSGKGEGWDRVYIHQDLTPKQRQLRQGLVQEMKQRQAKGEKNLIIANGRIVTKHVRVDKEEV